MCEVTCCTDLTLSFLIFLNINIHIYIFIYSRTWEHYFDISRMINNQMIFRGSLDPISSISNQGSLNQCGRLLPQIHRPRTEPTTLHQGVSGKSLSQKRTSEGENRYYDGKRRQQFYLSGSLLYSPLLSEIYTSYGSHSLSITDCLSFGLSLLFSSVAHG